MVPSPSSSGPTSTLPLLRPSSFLLFHLFPHSYSGPPSSYSVSPLPLLTPPLLRLSFGSAKVAINLTTR